ncbi:alpha/beta hydrolase [Methylobacterium sp. EM32]|uniref:alpha/beta hydrolase n=1 Tax=Methylobacterium sp. EM32 TaxID=3163481 RepID=UPI0033B6FA66
MSGSEPDGFHHIVLPASAPGAPPLLLLHGTGGDETELLPFARSLSPGSAVLAVRGSVSENGKLRFFPRLSEGVFDEDAVRRHAGALARFVLAACTRHGLAPPVAVGYSNGANVAAAILQHHAGVLAGAVLLRAVNPLRTAPRAHLSRTRILVLAGEADEIAPPALGEGLAATLRSQGGEVEFHRVVGGHGLIADDLAVARRWLGAGHPGPG